MGPQDRNRLVGQAQFKHAIRRLKYRRPKFGIQIPQGRGLPVGVPHVFALLEYIRLLAAAGYIAPTLLEAAPRRSFVQPYTLLLALP